MYYFEMQNVSRNYHNIKVSLQILASTSQDRHAFKVGAVDTCIGKFAVLQYKCIHINSPFYVLLPYLGMENNARSFTHLFLLQ